VKVLISGGAGFLGRQFLIHHLEHRDDITAIDNLSSAGSYWLPNRNYDRQTQDVRDLFRSSDDEWDLAYHFAAPVGGRLKIEGDPLYNAGSLELDSMFFRWAVGHVKTAVYPSSSAVYGVDYQGASAGALHEGLFYPTADGWARPDEMYGFTKMAGEVLAAKAAGYGLNTLCIRPFSGYGTGQSMDYPVPSICQRALNREDPLVIWGSGSQTRDFIHVSDIVGATAALLKRGIVGYEAINLGSGVATSFVEIASRAAEIIGYHPAIETDESKPEGVSTRFSDPARMFAVYQPKVSLRSGLAEVISSLK